MILDAKDPLLQIAVARSTSDEIRSTSTKIRGLRLSNSGLRLRGQRLFERGVVLPEIPTMDVLGKIAATTQDPREIAGLRLSIEGEIDVSLRHHMAKPIAAHFARTAFSCLETARNLDVVEGFDVNDRTEIMKSWMSVRDGESDKARTLHDTIHGANLQRAAWRNLNVALYLSNGFDFPLNTACREAESRSL